VDDLDARLAELERRMVQMNASYETMNKRFLELTEMKYVLRETAFIFDEV
jgi:V-type H+-transporting ATPase subunit a